MAENSVVDVGQPTCFDSSMRGMLRRIINPYPCTLSVLPFISFTTPFLKPDLSSITYSQRKVFHWRFGAMASVLNLPDSPITVTPLKLGTTTSTSSQRLPTSISRSVLQPLPNGLSCRLPVPSRTSSEFLTECPKRIGFPAVSRVRSFP